MNAFEHRLLNEMNTKPGRVGFPMTVYEQALPLAQRLLDEGYIRERRLGDYPGFQITDRGRAYLEGEKL